MLELCAEAAAGWSRIQATFLILRLSLATKFIFYAQTVDPQIALPFAREFDQIITESFSKLLAHLMSSRKMRFDKCCCLLKRADVGSIHILC